jgi:hypothetical protein
VGDLDHLRHRQERSRSPSCALHGDLADTRQERRQSRLRRMLIDQLIGTPGQLMVADQAQ